MLDRLKLVDETGQSQAMESRCSDYPWAVNPRDTGCEPADTDASI